MPKDKIVAGLDFGDDQISCVIVREKEEGGALEILGASKIGCKTVKKGALTDIVKTSQAIEKVVQAAEAKLDDVSVENVFLAVRGLDIMSENGKGTYNINRSDNEITQDDISHVLDNALAPYKDREILQTIAKTYIVDGERGITNPEGMQASVLGVEVHCLTVNPSHLRNIVNAVARSGFNVINAFYNGVVLGDCVLTPEEKETGTILVDIGGATTSIVFYKHGSIQFSQEIECGGHFITRDIALRFRLNNSEAKRIKEKFGFAFSDDIKEPQTITDEDVSADRLPSQEDLAEIIQSSVEDMMFAIEEVISKLRYGDDYVTIVFTGGGSLLRGLLGKNNKTFESQIVRLGAVQKEFVKGKDEFFTAPYSTALAAAIYPVVSGNGYEVGSSKTRPSKILKSVAEKINSIFGSD